MSETSSSTAISTKIERIAKLARQSPTMVLTTLAHHIDEEWLHEAYRRTRKDGARGIDGQSGQEYATGLEQRLQSLLERPKTGRYRAPPVRRVHIPKGNGETRPLGIPTFEDKVLQRKVQPRLRGRTLLVRYADDAVMLFEYEDDARRVMDVLPKRFGRYGLALHPEKTRLVPFKRPDRADLVGPRASTFSDSPSTRAKASLAGGW
jgi:hypothetical protein